MKQAKKLLALFLAAAMLTGTLASCSNNSGETSGTEIEQRKTPPLMRVRRATRWWLPATTLKGNSPPSSPQARKTSTL